MMDVAQLVLLKLDGLALVEVHTVKQNVQRNAELGRIMELRYVMMEMLLMVMVAIVTALLSKDGHAHLELLLQHQFVLKYVDQGQIMEQRLVMTAILYQVMVVHQLVL